MERLHAEKPALLGALDDHADLLELVDDRPEMIQAHVLDGDIPAGERGGHRSVQIGVEGRVDEHDVEGGVQDC